MSKQILNDNTTSDLKNSLANASGDTSLHLTNGPAITDDNTCVVCFKNVEIYSIGECDHPVCYECSTRMRVLCQQNECPICRKVLSKVIFTFDKLSYRELETKNRSEYYSKKYKIGFYTSSIQQAFFELLNHQCPRCDSAPFRNFNALQNHVRKEHDLHYCDLCRDHLKIFTFERRCYTQSELGLHRVKGDADNKSHRGHPLCEYCNCRYMDRDELFRHLRRDHYFCHFCDADGFNDFYRDYNALAEHFRQDHYLCEEGKCSTEQFTGAFRTEIDYKAHVAHVHGRSLNKQQVKQARTLQLEITLGRRGRPGQTAPDGACVGWSSRGNEDEHEEPPDLCAVPAQSSQRAITIDARNEVDFPSLNGVSAPSVSLIRPSTSYKSCGSVSGLARTKENFPALGSGPSTSTAPNCPTTHSISNVVKRSQATVNATPARATTSNTVGSSSSSSNPGGSTGLVIHVSNRPSAQAGIVGGSKKANAQDFPALPNAKHKKHAINNRENHMDDAPQLPLANISAKHRSLVDDYVSVANRSTFQKIQVVRKGDMTKVEEKKPPPSSPSNIPKLTALDFPSLGISGSVSSSNGGGSGSGSAIIGSNVDCTRNGTNSWAKALDKKQRESENRKLKIALAPVLPKSNNRSTGNNHNSSESSLAAGMGAKREKKPTDKVHGGDATALQCSHSLDGNGKTKINNNGNKSEKANVNNDVILPITATVNNNDTHSIQINRPPPGFDADADENSSLLKPPPGFQSNIMVNSIVKSPNNLTFTSSLGESYNIITAHTYIQPADFIIRNQKLIGHFKENLDTPEALNDFRYISQKFREGVYKTSAYYEHCQRALKDNFDKIFPELLVLLPDISKQQALYLVHFQRLKNLSIDERKLQTNLEVCAVCKQVLVSMDLENHKNVHKIKEQFPILNLPLKKESGGK